MKRSELLAESAYLLALLAAGTLVGAFFDAAGWGFGIAALIAVLWQVRQSHRIHTWWQSKDTNRPRSLPPLWQSWTRDLARVRKEQQEEEANRLRLQRSFDALSLAMPDAAVVVDSELRIEWYNAAAKTLLHFQDSDHRQVLTHVLRHPELVTYLRTGDFALPLELGTFMDTQNPVSVTVTILDQHTRLIRFVDITHGLQLDRLRQEFVANVSHEIKSPLTVITGYLETMSERPEEPQDPRILHTMARQCQRMRRLVDDLLELSRLEASELQDAQLQHVDLSQLAGEVRQEAQGLTTEVQHAIELDGAAGLVVRGRLQELHSALFNLVSNALRYSPSGSKVIIKWRRKKHGIRLAVIDQGIGIPEEHIARITERFYRVDKARSRDTGGTGLGLAIVKHILHRHGARLQIDSQKDEGSTFTCVFPIPQEEAAGREFIRNDR